MWQAIKEVDRQIKILNEMGVKVYKVSQSESKFDSVGIKEFYTMNIPLNFSQEQEKKAKEHWRLLLTNNNKVNNKMIGCLTAASLIGSLVLIPTGIVGMIECIKAFQ